METTQLLCQDAFSKVLGQGQTCLATIWRFPPALGCGGVPIFQALRGVNVPIVSFVYASKGAKAETLYTK
jgi:hypothetical protein